MSYFKIYFCLFIILCVPAYAASDLYSFSSAQQDHDFHLVIKELRCLVCQNESLADSNAALAQDLRQQIYARVIEGQHPDEIKKFLISRYGNYVLFKPPLENNTMVLWFGPVLFLFIGVLVLFFLLRKHRTKKD